MQITLEQPVQKILYNTKRKKSELFGFILRKIISGSNIHLTNREYDIAQGVYDIGKWDTQYLKDKLTLDTYSLNNYKKRMIDKKILVKTNDGVILNKFFTDQMKSGGDMLELTFYIKVVNEENPPINSGETSLQRTEQGS